MCSGSVSIQHPPPLGFAQRQVFHVKREGEEERRDPISPIFVSIFVSIFEPIFPTSPAHLNTSHTHPSPTNPLHPKHHTAKSLLDKN